MEDQGGLGKPERWLDAEERISELEKIVADKDLRLEEWRRLHPISTLAFGLRQSIEEMRGDLNRIKDELSRASSETSIPIVISWLNCISFLFAAIVIGGFVLIFRQGDTAKLYDYLGYVFPIMAGWVAGLGLYARSATTSAFGFSVTLLIAGLLCYLKGKVSIQSYLFAILVIFDALVLTFWTFFPKKESRMGANTSRVKFILVFVLILYVVAFFFSWAA